MLAVKFEDKHIREAEQLLIKGNTFCPERLDFIKSIKTCDLLAVPGSGKTTALLAKLYCLSKQIPFSENAGVLVLAHTNASVDEIKLKLQKHCPNLFEYPSFVGTIQGFVNEFLAKSANLNKYNSYIRWNDNDIYNLEAVKFYYSLPWGQKGKSLKRDLYGKANYNKKTSSHQEREENTIEFIQSIKFDFVNEKLTYGNKNTTLYTSTGKAKDKYDTIVDWKESILSKGILSFIDSYYLSEWYINKYPKNCDFLQKRFRFVFIDEMQDLEVFQIELIDKLFHTKDSNVNLQRIGDINQSIYNRVKKECVWVTREEENSDVYIDKYINGSNRLSPENANLIDYFTYDCKKGKFRVVGCNTLYKPIRPHLIVFNNKVSGKELQSKFIELINLYKLTKLPHITEENAGKYFKIIGWTGEHEKNNDSKQNLNTLFSYKKQEKNKREDFSTLSRHIQLFDKEKKTLESIRKSILNALITILKYEEIQLVKTIRGKDVARYYTKDDLIKAISNLGEDVYENFKLTLFNWCFSIVTKKNYEEVYNSIVKFIKNDFISWFNEIRFNDSTMSFIGNTFEKVVEYSPLTTSKGLQIDVATVHSVKGQTHCATMYVETENFTPAFETEKLKEKGKNKEVSNNPLFKEKHNCKGNRAIEALKMMYVGFSRPTHLLCFAVLEENVKDDIEKFKKADWIIDSSLIK